MNFSAPTLVRPLLFTFLLGTTGLLTSACLKDEPAVTMPAQDYTAIDEALIKKYVDDNKLTNAQRQSSGLYYVPLTTVPGGVQATQNKSVSVLYTGTLLNGTVFDASSRNGNRPLEFTLGQGQVIKGWDEGIALMRKGEKSILLIPSALAYGSRGAGGGAIPPNTVLRFDVELKEIK